MEDGSILQLLSWLPQSAFWAKDNAIYQANASARARFFEPGMELRPLLGDSWEEYEAYTGGELHLTLTTADRSWNACLRCHEGQHIFTLEPDEVQPELQALALASVQLRQSMSGIIMAAERIQQSISEPTPSEAEYGALMHKSIQQVLRMLGNMSDAARYSSQPGPAMEALDLNALLSEVFEKVSTLLEQAQLTLEYSLPPEPVFLTGSGEMLERAVHNLLSNAAKFSRPGSSIRAVLTRKNRRLYLTVQDSGDGISPDLRGTIHNRYLRQPELADSRYGIGLGMNLVFSAARAHGGTVLVEYPEAGGTKVTVALPIRVNTGELRSERLRVDYAGEWDHTLLELSDVLPTSAYYSKK